MMNQFNKISSSIRQLTKFVALCGLCSLLVNQPRVGFSQENNRESAVVANSDTNASLDEKQSSPEKSPAAATDGTSDKATSSVMRKPSAGRLPPYFASLVDSRQREAIYQIRATMATKISELEKQLEELRKAEMLEIERVLTDDQLQQLEALRAARSVARSATPASRE